jgi:hypothetical protein
MNKGIGQRKKAKEFYKRGYWIPVFTGMAYNN